MAVDDRTRLTRKYGYSAIYLRRLLHGAIPETSAKDSNIISLLVECGAAQPDELDAGTLSKWLSGKAPCDIGKIRALLKSKSKLDGNAIGEHIGALDYMQRHAQALPNLPALPNVPAAVRQFLAALTEAAAETIEAKEGEILLSGSAIVEAMIVNTGKIGDVTAEVGAEVEVSGITAPHFEIGEVTAEQGAVARVRNLNVGESFAIGNVRAGAKKGKT